MEFLQLKSLKHPLLYATLLCTTGLASSVDGALLSRLNGSVFYDDVANLSWLADANFAFTSGFDDDGRMTWTQANDWASGLIVEGVSGWRLPDTAQPDTGCSGQSGDFSAGYGCTGSELGNLFYNVLGGESNQSITTTHNPDYDLFSNIQSNRYWSATTQLPADSGNAWQLSFATGYMNGTAIESNNYAWAVQSGDVGLSRPLLTVPLPGAFVLYGSGLLCLFSLMKRFREESEQ